MERISSLLGPDPLSSEVGQLIDRATSDINETEDWALNMEICDVINQTEEGPKDAVKAMKKKLQQNAGKGSHIINLILTVAETCVKNCGHALHVQIATRDFLDELTKVLSPKYNPSQAVQERVLLLIQSWADAFRGKHDLREVERVYQELRAKGIEFPAADLDRMAPIFTPARSVHSSHQENAFSGPSGQPNAETQVNAYIPPSQAGGITTGSLNLQQNAKLTRDLEAIKTNCTVLTDMIATFTPGEEPSDDYQLMVELEGTCREMQHRLLDLIGSGQISDEIMVSNMLKLNDDLNVVFLKYERHTRARNQTANKSSTQAKPPVPEPAPVSVLQPPPPIVRSPAASNNTANLIDFGPEDTTEPASEPIQPIDEREQLASLFSTATVSARESTDPFRSALSASGYDASGVPSSSAGLSTAVNAKAAGLDPSQKRLDQLEDQLANPDDWFHENSPKKKSTSTIPPPPPRTFEKSADDNSPFGL